MFEAFKTGLGGSDLKASFGKNPERQDPGGGLVVYDQNAPDAGKKGVAGSFGRFRVARFVRFGFVVHLNTAPRKSRCLSVL
jgi:hypothetical protein